MAAEDVFGGISSAKHWLYQISVHPYEDERSFTFEITSISIAVDAPLFQALIDGEPGASSGAIGPFEYTAETDQLAIKCQDGHTVTIARALIAPQLATALKLRQPMDLGAKPAKT